METVKLFNGNHQVMVKDMPKIVIRGFINDVALEHIKENTGLEFKKDAWNNYEVQPTESNQIVRLFMTYNFKTRHYDNWDFKNTIILKSDHHIGFDVDSICMDCCEKNNINKLGLDAEARLAC